MTLIVNTAPVFTGQNSGKASIGPLELALGPKLCSSVASFRMRCDYRSDFIRRSHLKFIPASNKLHTVDFRLHTIQCGVHQGLVSGPVLLKPDMGDVIRRHCQLSLSR